MDTPYIALIFCLYPEHERNFSTLIELINASETREEDETFKNAVDDQFDFLNAWVNEDLPDNTELDEDYRHVLDNFEPSPQQRRIG